MSARTLPDRPDLDQLRRQAKELRDAARADDAAALERIRALAPDLDAAVLTTAQLVIAREYGCASWAELKTKVETVALSRAQRVEAFLAASVSAMTMRQAARLLAIDPGIAGDDFRAAVVLGDSRRVAGSLARDPGLAVRPDAWSGWLPLHGVCMSRWHRIDPARSAGMLEVARLLLDAGADPDGVVGRRGEPTYCAPLFAAAGCADHPALTALLLERGGSFDDHTVYLAAFHQGHDCLRLLLDHQSLEPDSNTLAAPISTGDSAGVRLLLDAGADPTHPLPGDLFGESYPAEPPIPPAYAAVRFGCPTDLVELLLARGGDPDAAGGPTAYRLAVRQGRTDLAALLTRYGARDEATPIDSLLDACLRADRSAAERLLRDHPGLSDRLTDTDHAALVHAADHGATEAVRLMLDLGFPIGARDDVDGATALHAAAGSGSVEVVRLLLERGADLDARDTTWGSPAVHWATVGSGQGFGHAARPDWVATVQALIDAGAPLDGAWIDGKPPGPEVAQLLSDHGISGSEIATA